MAARRCAVKHRLVVDDIAEVAHFGRSERGDIRRIALRHFACGRNLVVHDEHDALALHLGRGGRLNGFEKIHRAVGRNRGRGAHCAHEHHGLVALDRKIEEIGRFLDRIGAVRNDHAVNLRVRDERIDALGELEKRRRIHVVRGNLRDLFAGDFRVILHLRHSVDERLDADSGGIVACCVCSARSSARNGAACGDDLDDGKRMSCASYAERKRKSGCEESLFHGLVLQLGSQNAGRRRDSPVRTPIASVAADDRRRPVQKKG